MDNLRIGSIVRFQGELYLVVRIAEYNPRLYEIEWLSKRGSQYRQVVSASQVELVGG